MLGQDLYRVGIATKVTCQSPQEASESQGRLSGESDTQAKICKMNALSKEALRKAFPGSGSRMCVGVKVTVSF